MSLIPLNVVLGSANRETLQRGLEKRHWGHQGLWVLAVLGN